MFRSAAICAALLAASLVPSALAGDVTSLSIGDLASGDRLEVRTANYSLRLDVVDPITGEAQASLARDGKSFGRADRVFVLGATRGRHPEGLMVVRMGQLEVGKGMELAVHTMDAENRRITAPVTAFRVIHGAGSPVQRP